MKNIVLVGLQYDNNIGDQAIFYATRCLLDEVLKDYPDEEIEIRCMDMVGRSEMGVNPIKGKVESKQSPVYLSLVRFAKKIRTLRKYANHYSLFKLSVSKKEYEKVEQMSILNCSQHFDENTVGVLFTGGGIIKFHKQMFHVYMRTIINYAHERNIPVMISAAGIEGYDEKDQRCIALKQALTCSSVKVITTRDDLSNLEKYCGGSSQVIAQVADPACSLSRFIPAAEHSERRRVVGICLIRPEIFDDYGIKVSEKELFELWKTLYLKITAAGDACRFFITGTVPDQKTMEKFREYLCVKTPADASVFCPRPMSVKDLTDIITGCDAVIASRLHASIIAYAYRVPCTALVWNVKQRIFGKVIGHPERFIEREHFNADEILELLKKASEEGYDEQRRSEYCATTGNYISRFIHDHVMQGNYEKD
ncbi:MAG: polysaccharide pyruvyl transferase family protein [Solobacterium sp.]|nr:polysaccharide pyruvyl transferase family protein [Solobacterium sp.]